MKSLAGVLLSAAFCHAAPPLNQTLAGACPLTTAEKSVQTTINTRKAYYDNDLTKAINSGDYGVGKLTADLNGWKSSYISNMGTGVNTFKTLMQDAKSKGEGSSGWNAALSDLLSLLIEAGGGSWASPINTAISGMQDTFKGFQKGQQYPDFLAAAIAWYQDVNNKQNQLTLQITRFTDEVSKLVEAGDKVAVLKAAHHYNTVLYENMPSSRDQFNTYYARYMLSAKITSLPEFAIVWLEPLKRYNHPEQYMAFPMTPPGLDACTIAAQVHHENLGCINDETKGLGNILGFRVVTQVYPLADQGSIIRSSIVHGCGKLTAGAYINCESGDLDWGQPGSIPCKKALQEVPLKAGDPSPSDGPALESFPNSFQKEKCSTKVVPGQPFYAQTMYEGGNGQYQPKFHKCG